MTEDEEPWRGSLAVLDRWIRRFGRLAHLLAVLTLYALLAGVIALALAPALAMLWHGWPWALAPSGWLRWALAGLGFGLAFFVGGFSLLLVVALANRVLPTRVRAYDGGYDSLAAVPWALHNGLFYLARYTFLPYVTLTPFGPGLLAGHGHAHRSPCLRQHRVHLRPLPDPHRQ